MGLFIENNSTYGDIIVINVRGQSAIHVQPYDSTARRVFRQLGTDRLPNCIMGRKTTSESDASELNIERKCLYL